MINNTSALQSALLNIAEQLKMRMANAGFSGKEISIRLNKPGYVVTLLMTAHNVLQAQAVESGEGRTVKDARAFATAVHGRRTAKTGLPHTGHLGRVAARARSRADALGLTERAADLCEQVGWLLDSIESTEATAADLTAAGFAKEVIDAVLLLTQPAGADFQDHIRTIMLSSNTLVAIVKLSELRDNLDPEQVASLTDDARKRYEAAAESINEKLGKREIGVNRA